MPSSLYTWVSLWITRENTSKVKNRQKKMGSSLLLYSPLCWAVVSSLTFYAQSGNADLEFESLFSPGKGLTPAHSPLLPFVVSERKRGFSPNSLFLKRWVALELEEVFCSKMRMRILKLLFQCSQLNTTDLARRLGANYAVTLRHLILLKNEDVVEERLGGRTRFFRFKNSLRTQTVSRLLKEWESQ